MKDKLRAWLIDLVREAIRSELNGYSSDFTDAVIRKSKPAASIKPQPIIVEPSFEQMQAEALKAQEEFYEPKRA